MVYIVCKVYMQERLDPAMWKNFNYKSLHGSTFRNLERFTVKKGLHAGKFTVRQVYMQECRKVYSKKGLQ